MSTIEPDQAQGSREAAQAGGSLWNRQWRPDGHIVARLHDDYRMMYNRHIQILAFCDTLPPDAERDAAIDNVEASLEAIYLTNGTGSFGQQLHCDMYLVVSRVLAVDQWYRHGDLFDFSDRHLEELLLRSKSKILQDPAPFAGYLREHMHQSVTRHDFSPKLEVILQVLSGNSRGVHEAFLLLKDTLERVCRPGTLLYAAVRRKMQNLREGLMSKDGDVNMSSKMPSSRPLDFLDYASACRHLRGKSGNINVYDENNAIALLRVLQRRAWKQIQSKAYLVCGPQLPVELVECIFQHILRKEDIPSDACEDDAPAQLIEDWRRKSASGWKDMPDWSGHR